MPAIDPWARAPRIFLFKGEPTRVRYQKFSPNMIRTLVRQGCAVATLPRDYCPVPLWKLICKTGGCQSKSSSSYGLPVLMDAGLTSVDRIEGSNMRLFASSAWKLRPTYWLTVPRCSRPGLRSYPGCEQPAALRRLVKTSSLTLPIIGGFMPTATSKPLRKGLASIALIP